MRLINWSVSVALLLLNLGCQSGPMPGFMIKEVDKPVCTNLGDHGWCRNTVSDVKFFVDNKSRLFTDPLTKKKQTWNTLLRTAVIVPADSWVALKGFIDNVCHQMNCSNGVGSWNQLAQEIDDNRGQ